MQSEKKNKLMLYRDTLLIVWLILLPFNLVFGIIFPSMQSLPAYPADLLLLFIGILTLVKLREKNQKTIKEQQIVIIIICLFILFSFINIIQNSEAITDFITSNNQATIQHSFFKKIISADITHTINKAIHFFLSLLLFIAISRTALKREQLLKYAMIPVAVIILINSYLLITQQDLKLDGGIFGSYIVPYSINEYGRIYFPFVNATLLSMYLSIMFFAALYFFFSRRKKTLSGLFLMVIIITTSFTKTRAALVVMLILFLAVSTSLLIIEKKYRQKRVIMWLICIASVLLITNMLTFIFHQVSLQETADKFKSANETTEKSADRTETSIQTQEKIDETITSVKNQYRGDFNKRRTNYHWPTAITLWKTNPWFGVGQGLFFNSVIDKHKNTLCAAEKLCQDNIQPSDISSTAHSIYLQILAETGVVGVILFVALLMLIAREGYSKIKQRDTLALFLCLALLGFMVQGIFFSYVEYPDMQYVFWLLAGLIIKKDIANVRHNRNNSYAFAI